MVQSVVDLFQQLARNEFGFFSRLGTVAEVMDSRVPVVNSEMTLGEVIGRGDPYTAGSYAVTDAQKGDVIGILRQSTILRCSPRFINTLKENDRDRTVLAMNVCDFVTRRLPHVRPEDEPLKALEIMVRHRQDFVLVYDDPHQILGVVTPCCFAKTMLLYYRVFQQMQPLQRLRLVDLDSDLSLDEIFCRGSQTARDVMSPPESLGCHEPVATAVSMMSAGRSEHLPVLEPSGKIAAVVSRNDILLALQPPSRPGLIDHSVDMQCLSVLIAAGQETILAEPVTSVARGKILTVSPTSRVAETLSILVENERDAIFVVDNQQILGIVTLMDIVRVFRTLMRLRTLKDN